MDSQRTKNLIIQNRSNLKAKLKGTLGAWKFDPKIAQESKNESVQDRTPVVGEINFTFDDAFELQKKIGEGASGSVYVCQSKKEKKQFAVKISRGDEELIRIAKKNFKFLNQINHPSVIKAKYLFLDEVREKIYLVMDYFPAPSLQRLCHLLTVEQKKYILQKILEILKYLHKIGICHRDIKSENILYDRKTKELKLIDFGICKQLMKRNNFMNKMWTITGTLQYMAPEVLIGADYNEKVDCWATGIMAYKLFYDKFPFQSQYKSDTIKQIVETQPQYFGQYKLLNDFLKSLLKKQPKTRSSAEQALKHPLIEIFPQTTKRSRLNSDQNFDWQTKFRLRNYSITMDYSSTQQLSREEIINNLKEINIFESKKLTKKILTHSI